MPLVKNKITASAVLNERCPSLCLDSVARALRVSRLTHNHCRERFDADGFWCVDEPAPDARKTLWLCFGLLGDAGNAEAIRLANRALAALPFALHSKARTPEEAAAGFDIFVTNHAVQMLVAHGEKLTSEVRLKLEGWARAALGDFPGDRQADYQFHAANDNMPSKATLGLVLGGEYFGDESAVAHGLWNLRQLREMLTRRGLIGEYASPTYSPLTLVNLTEIALHARHPECAELARQCAERVWADVLGHFHPPTRTMAGPYSRAYQLDSTAHFSTSACLLWLALGEEGASFDPVAELERDPVRLVHHHSDRTTQIGVLAWLTSCPLTPPAHLLRWVENRGFPFHLNANAERCGPDAGEVNTTHYAEEDFAIGTSIGESWTRNQAEAFFLQYRRRAPLRDVTDVRTLYLRYLIDNQVPTSSGNGDMLRPQGLVHAVHKDRVAIVVARPLVKLAGQPLTTLRFSAVVPTHFGPLGRVEIVPSAKGGGGGHVFIQDGPMHIALRGLNAFAGEDSESGIVFETTPDGDFQVVSFLNYAGEARTYSADEIVRVLNGMVIVTGLAAEESFEAFKARVGAARLLDYCSFDQRTITYELGDTRLATAYSLPADKFRFTAIDGLPAPRPIWEATGLPAKALPFFDEAPRLNPLADFPYKHLGVIWAPTAPWKILSDSR